MARRGPRVFATPKGVPRARRSTDAILLVSAIAGLAALSLAEAPPSGFGQSVTTFLTSFPDLLDTFWQASVDLLSLLALVLLAASIVTRRGGLARDLVLAAVVAIGVFAIVARWTSGSWPDLWAAFDHIEPPPLFPSMHLAVPAAAVITASPHLARPFRRVGRWSIAVAMFAVAALGATSPVGALAALLIATIAAATVHLVFGSCGGRPGLDDVRSALAELGVDTTHVGAADRQPAGLFLVHARDAAGDPLIVKVYGRDAHDSALMSTLWRNVWYREAGSPLRLGRRQQVEHEAFLTLLAAQGGVLTDRVVTAGATGDDDAVLVLRPAGDTLVDAAAGSLSPRLGDLWSLVERVRAAGITHGRIDDSTLLLVDGQLGLRDFRGATVAPTDVQHRTDEVQTYVTSVLEADKHEAAAAALEALGDDGVEAMLPYLQPAALTPRQRSRLRSDGIDLDELRDAAAAVAGTTAPDLQQLRRVTLRSVIAILLPALVLVALVSAASGLDVEQLWEELQDATWWLVAVGFAVGQLPRVTQAMSTLGASPVPLALGPVYALQLAISYINIAIPTAAARIAVNIRFFQRHGVPAGSAIAVGALDGFSGFVVQAFLLIVLLLFTSTSLDLDLDSGTASTAARLLGLVLIVAVVAIAAVVVVPRLRHFVLRWGRRLLTEALSALRGLRSPRRIALLLGGNLASELLFALTLGTMAMAMGTSVGLGELLLINISVSLLSGVIPVPGGIGVTEGGLTLGLVRAGMSEEAAFAAVILYRLATFYVPPIWGFFALRWLERNKHL